MTEESSKVKVNLINGKAAGLDEITPEILKYGRKYFKKAFDSINREIMLLILKSYGIPYNIIQAIVLTYKDTYAKVITPDGET